MNRLRSATIAAVALLLPLSVSVPASAVVVRGQAADRRGDARIGQQDLRSVGVRYDSSGVVEGIALTQKVAYDPELAVISIGLGHRRTAGSICRIEFDVDIYPNRRVDDIDTFATLYRGKRTLRDQEVTREGNLFGFDTSTGDGFGEGKGPLGAIANRPWNCAVGRTVGPRDIRKPRARYVTYDETRVFALKRVG